MRPIAALLCLHTLSYQVLHANCVAGTAEYAVVALCVGSLQQNFLGMPSGDEWLRAALGDHKHLSCAHLIIITECLPVGSTFDDILCCNSNGALCCIFYFCASNYHHC